MALTGTRTCDICGEEVAEKTYVEMRIKDLRVDNIIKEDDVCLACFDRLRSFIRNGMPKIVREKSS